MLKVDEFEPNTIKEWRRKILKELPKIDLKGGKTSYKEDLSQIEIPPTQIVIPADQIITLGIFNEPDSDLDKICNKFLGGDVSLNINKYLEGEINNDMNFWPPSMGLPLDDIPVAAPIKPPIKIPVYSRNSAFWDRDTPSLPDLLKQIETEKDPTGFKEAILRTIQMYYDGLVEGDLKAMQLYYNELVKGDVRAMQSYYHGLIGKDVFKRGPKIWAEQKKVLTAILKGVRLTVSGYYINGQDIPFSEVQNAILPHSSAIIEHGPERRSKPRHLARNEGKVQECMHCLTKILADEEIDLIIPVTSGGFEPAALIAEHLGVTRMLPIRYSGVERQDKEVLIPSHAPAEYAQRQIKNKRVLIFDDVLSGGTTASKTTEWVSQYDPAKLYFAVVMGGSQGVGKVGLRFNRKFHRHETSDYLFTYRPEERKED